MFTLLAGVLFFCGIFGAIIILLFVIMAATYRAFAVGSGYDELARRFPAMHVPAGQRHDWQNVRIGAVRWRRCATVIIGPEGLYLAFMPQMPVLGRPSFNRHPAVLIPWHELRSAAPATLYWQRAVALSVGEPTIAVVAVYQSLFAQMEPYTPLRMIP